jgi:hypothetical protein
VSSPDWTAWEAIGDIITARYVRFKITVTDADPILREAFVTLSAEPIIELIEDLDTSDLYGTDQYVEAGHVFIPLIGEFQKIKHVFVTLQNVGAGWTWELISKDDPKGPAIKIWDGTGTLDDAVIDARVQGV